MGTLVMYQALVSLPTVLRTFHNKRANKDKYVRMNKTQSCVLYVELRMNKTYNHGYVGHGDHVILAAHGEVPPEVECLHLPVLDLGPGRQPGHIHLLPLLPGKCIVFNFFV